jgi:hypothetical protein
MLCQMLRGARGPVKMEGRLVTETSSFIGWMEFNGSPIVIADSYTKKIENNL